MAQADIHKTGAASKASARPAVCSIGSINADFTAEVERRPDISETLLASAFHRAGGGKGANVAIVARRFGAPSVLVGRVGDDDLAAAALAPLRRCGVDLAAVSARWGEPTGVSMITVPPDGQKGIILAANANRSWEEGADAAVRATVAQQAPGSVVVVDCEVPSAIVAMAIATAAEAGFAFILDPSPAEDLDPGLLARLDVIVPNAGEAETLTGLTVDGPATAAEAARRLLGAGVRRPVVKMREGGCVFLDGTDAVLVPAADVTVVDSNGAGDSFAGTLAVGLLDGLHVRDAAVLATAAASLTVTRRGAQAAFPERHETERVARSLAGKIHSL